MMTAGRELLFSVLVLLFVVASAKLALSQSEASPVRVGGDIAEPRKVRHVNPVYPDEAKQAGIEDAVFADCTIDTQGQVSELTILRGHPSLAAAVETAVRQWRYTPTQLNGVPVPIVLTVTVNYRLEGGSPTAALMRALEEDPHPQVRQIAASTLQFYCPARKEACAALDAALEDPDDTVQNAARQALERANAR